MMSKSEVAEIRNAGEDVNNEFRIETHKLDTIENGGVNLQCVNSSEFMVGKQTNFNGPVTIINCTDGKELESFRGRLPDREEVVIKDRVMNPTVTTMMGNFGTNASDKEKLEGKKNVKYIVEQTCTRNFLKIPVFVWSILVFIILAGLVTMVTEFYLYDRKYKSSYITVNGTQYQFVTRKEWGAAKAKSTVILKLPVPYVVVSHTATGSCYSRSECIPSVLEMQTSNINKRKFPDIKYNFLVGGDGIIYEGRGWNFRSEAQGRANNQNIDIAFIGNFDTYVPTPPQSETVNQLINYAVQNKYLAENYSLIPAHLTCSTRSPGKHVVEIIKDWPHYKGEWTNEIAFL